MSFRFRIFPFILFFTGVLTGVSFYFMIEEKCPKSIKESSRSSSLRRYSTSVPMLFIGGHPRSGTTLMRVLLDAHPLYHCGQETHIIPDLLTLQRKYSRGRNFERIREAGLDLEAINRLIAETILNIIQSRGALNSRQRLCNKDPFVLKHISYLARMFPKAQFILMVRDPRAVIHSIRENKIKISRFPKKNSDAFRRWNKILEIMFKDCLLIGKQRCKILHYERLVLKPRFTLQEILRFLQSPWSENVMNHTEHLNRAGGILLSSLERSTHQVRKPIYQDSLHLWMTSSSLNVSSKQLVALAPMMITLGYNGIGHPPEYAKLKEKYSRHH